MWIETTYVTKAGKKAKGKYRICWREANGRRRTKVAFTDLRASRQMLADMQRTAARNEVGLFDPHESSRRLPVIEHLDAWIASLKEAGKSDAYTTPSRRRIERLTEACGWKRLDEVSGDSFVKWRRSATSEVYHQRTDRSAIPVKPISNRTKNHFYDALKAFSNWCVRNGRMPASWSPLVAVQKLPQVGHEKRKRRAFTEAEQQRFLAAVPSRHRQVILLAFGTGLRRRELRLLRWSNVSLQDTAPYVQPPATIQKGRRDDIVPLRSDLADMLRQRFAESDDEQGDRVFRTMPSNDRFNSWLGNAGIEKADANGRRLDFHAMRHTFNTEMLKAGIPLAHAQKLMRHTDPKLTANAYADAGQFPLAEGLEKLPLLAVQWGNKGANVPPDTDSSRLMPTDPESAVETKRLDYQALPPILAELLMIRERAGDGSRTHNS
ncbi:MAG: site-specific recombinase XerD [Phycisphaerales bacterium]|nr:site-specific recombinase XerD [Phycisphaerales bacterium]